MVSQLIDLVLSSTLNKKEALIERELLRFFQEPCCPKKKEKHRVLLFIFLAAQYFVV